MLRVLVLSTLFPDATRPNFGIFVERHVQALAARDDVAVQVIAPRGLPPFPFDRLGHYRPLAALPLKEAWNGLSVYRPRFTNIPGANGRFHAAAITRAVKPILAGLRRDFPFDVIAAEYFFPDGVAAIRLGRHFDVPVSIKARGSDIHRWAGSPSVGTHVRSAGRAADGMVAVSDAMRADMIALGMPAERIMSIPNGVDMRRFHPRHAADGNPDGAHPLILSVGALIAIKGHAIVIDAVAALPGVRMLIAGEGPDRERLEALIAARGIGDRVRLLGSVPHGEVPQLLASADVMALASEREGLANVWLEALASGTPVVIPDVGGARQVVRSGAAGRIVARAPAAFAAGIAELLGAPPDPADTRACAASFTWEANAARSRDFLAGLVAAHARRASA